MITDVIIDIHDNMRGRKTKFDMICWKTGAFGLVYMYLVGTIHDR